MQDYVNFPKTSEGKIDQFAIFNSPEYQAEVVNALSLVTSEAITKNYSPLGFIQEVMNRTKPTTPEQVAMITYLATCGYNDIVNDPKTSKIRALMDILKN